MDAESGRRRVEDEPPPERKGLFRRLYAWTRAWASRPSATWALFAIAFAESSFFPVPPDVLLLALCGTQPRRSLWFALVTSLGSVLGGMAGYLLGYEFRDAGLALLRLVSSQETIDAVGRQYAGNVFWLLIVKAFTPIPYKVFAIAAGLYRIDFGVFVLASAIGRSSRFFLVGGALFWGGPKVEPLVEKYLGVIGAVLLVLVVVGFAALWALK